MNIYVVNSKAISISEYEVIKETNSTYLVSGDSGNIIYGDQGSYVGKRLLKSDTRVHTNIIIAVEYLEAVLAERIQKLESKAAQLRDNDMDLKFWIGAIIAEELSD